MNWLEKMQQNMGALVRSGQIQPETASKLEQFAVQQQQKTQQAGGLDPFALKSNQKKDEQTQQGNMLGSAVGTKIKEVMKPGINPDLTGTPDATNMKVDGSMDPNFIQALSNYGRIG